MRLIENFYMNVIINQAYEKNTFKKLEHGHNPKELVTLTDQIVKMIYNKTVQVNWKKRVKNGLALAEAIDAIERFRTGVEEATQLAGELLQGKEFKYWDYKEYKKRMKKVHEVVSSGQFTRVVTGTFPRQETDEVNARALLWRRKGI